jgi:hypothetical protein
MKHPLIFAAGLVASLALVGATSAASLQDTMESCLNKHANTTQAASVVLECNAAGGKLNDCKVVEDNSPSKGFADAALCVASALPIGAKTGTIRVPLRFTGS